MFKFLALLFSFSTASSAVFACNAVEFDYSSFTRPPQKLDRDRYLAGKEDVNYLSIGLRGITLQISPANYALDAQLEGIWQSWADTGAQHPDFENFHAYFEPPTVEVTPFGAGLAGYRSGIKPAYHNGDDPSVVNTILFLFAASDAGGGMASLYLNDPVGGGDMAAVMAELAALTTIDPACVSASGAYEGRYLTDQARYVVFPVEAFLDPL